MKIYILSAMLLLASFGCEKEKTLNNTDLAGYWIHPETDDNIVITFDRATAFVEDYGIAFFEDGSVVEKKNAGWCGTPPISYAEYDGTWEEEEAEIINVTSTYWGGTIEWTWKIISVDENTLVVEIID